MNVGKRIEDLRKKGYSRVRVNNEVRDLEEDIQLEKNKKSFIFLYFQKMPLMGFVSSAVFLYRI